MVIFVRITHCIYYHKNTKTLLFFINTKYFMSKKCIVVIHVVKIKMLYLTREIVSVKIINNIGLG